MGIRGENAVLIVQEVAMHPSSIVINLEKRFEKPSIIHVLSKDCLKSYQKAPIYDDKYLVLIESMKLFEANSAYFNLDEMFIVLLCSGKTAVSDATEFCKDKNIPYKVFVNEFTKDHARTLIQKLASTRVDNEHCDCILRRVGLNPRRILSAVMVCEQVGYSVTNINHYVDKYVYIDAYDVIESLLGICRSKAQRKRAAMYVHMNRLWYNKFTRVSLIKEVDLILKIYQDLLSGVLTPYTMQAYLEQEHLPRYRVIYAKDLYERISIVDLMILKKFLETASILEVAMKLS